MQSAMQLCFMSEALPGTMYLLPQRDECVCVFVCVQ